MEKCMVKSLETANWYGKPLRPFYLNQRDRIIEAAQRLPFQPRLWRPEVSQYVAGSLKGLRTAHPDAVMPLVLFLCCRKLDSLTLEPDPLSGNSILEAVFGRLQHVHDTRSTAQLGIRPPSMPECTLGADIMPSLRELTITGNDYHKTERLSLYSMYLEFHHLLTLSSLDTLNLHLVDCRRLFDSRPDIVRRYGGGLRHLRLDQCAIRSYDLAVLLRANPMLQSLHITPATGDRADKKAYKLIGYVIWKHGSNLERLYIDFRRKDGLEITYLPLTKSPGLPKLKYLTTTVTRLVGSINSVKARREPAHFPEWMANCPLSKVLPASLEELVVLAPTNEGLRFSDERVLSLLGDRRYARLRSVCVEREGSLAQQVGLLGWSETIGQVEFGAGPSRLPMATFTRV